MEQCCRERQEQEAKLREGHRALHPFPSYPYRVWRGGNRTSSLCKGTERETGLWASLPLKYLVNHSLVSPLCDNCFSAASRVAQLSWKHHLWQTQARSSVYSALSLSKQLFSRGKNSLHMETIIQRHLTTSSGKKLVPNRQFKLCKTQANKVIVRASSFQICLLVAI